MFMSNLGGFLVNSVHAFLAAAMLVSWDGRS